MLSVTAIVGAAVSAATPPAALRGAADGPSPLRLHESAKRCCEVFAAEPSAMVFALQNGQRHSHGHGLDHHSKPIKGSAAQLERFYTALTRANVTQPEPCRELVAVARREDPQPQGADLHERGHHPHRLHPHHRRHRDQRPHHVDHLLLHLDRLQLEEAEVCGHFFHELASSPPSRQPPPEA